MIDRALDAGYEPLSLLIPDHKLESMSKLLERAQEASKKSRDLPVFVAPAKEIEKLAGYELTRGVLCAMRRKPLLSVREFLEKTNARRVAILEDITNHTNVGAAFRSAAALGVDAVLVTPACCDPLYRRAVRVSMGTVFQVPWTRIGTTEIDAWPKAGLDLLRSEGFVSAALRLTTIQLRWMILFLSTVKNWHWCLALKVMDCRSIPLRRAITRCVSQWLME